MPLTHAQRALLLAWRRSIRVGKTSALARAERDVIAVRARIVLESFKGLSHATVAKRAGVSVATVCKWRARFVAGGPDGLLEGRRPRSGLPLTGDLRRAIASRITRASTREIAEAVGVSQSTVARARRRLRTWLP